MSGAKLRSQTLLIFRVDLPLRAATLHHVAVSFCER